MKLNPANIGIIKRLLVGRNNRPLRSILNKLEAADIASLLSTLNRREIGLLIQALISIGKVNDVLLEVPSQQLEEVLLTLSVDQLINIIIYSDEDDAAYLLSHLESEAQTHILDQLEDPKKQKILQFLSYPEDSAGRMMQTRVFCLPADLTASEGLKTLRSRAQHESIYYIYCVDETEEDEKGILRGILSLRQLATAAPEKKLSDLVQKDVITVGPETSMEEVARLVAHYDFIALPVVGKNKELLGIVTVDDVLDIIQEQATARLYAQAGLQEDDRVYSPTMEKVKNRLPWMFLNLFLAAIASSVVALFENTMHDLIILASLKNIVAGSGGNTAIQTLTVVTRGLATGDFSFITHRRAIIKETLVGSMIGLTTGLGAGVLTYLWKGNSMVAVVICISMFLNSLVASSCGALVPLTLKRLNYDPAAGSGVIVTIITDIFGFFSFLGIATLGLKYFT